jgi:hypothetical protein
MDQRELRRLDSELRRTGTVHDTSIVAFGADRIPERGERCKGMHPNPPSLSNSVAVLAVLRTIPRPTKHAVAWFVVVGEPPEPP